MIMHDVLSGAGAGLVATAPMTVAMDVMFRLLPRREQYPLPPSSITSELTDKAGLRGDLDREEHIGLTLVNHFAYGAATGALYGLLAGALRSRRPMPPLVSGIGWGLTVWSVSYLGLLPLVGLLRPATHQPAGRNLLMIAAHIVWGAVLGTLTERLQGWREAAGGNATRDRQ